MTPELTTAGQQDIPQLVALINSAYRGESSKMGWTTEADLLDGIRTDEKDLSEIISTPGAVILKYENGDELLGCVYLQKQDRQMYLGMLTVKPVLQAKGIGKKMMQAAEDYAVQQGCDKIVMTVISVRTELIAWYERRGYRLTGEMKPFIAGTHFGIQKQPVEFVVMEKKTG